ncbi:hypothetical protein CIL05_06680 [Virgibacillus profundi]|uniref:DUF2953 domain-containing protein n=1 Tax=Virgibacillus profundi TaxID=2024555 RepID=A0A2A2IFQ4_9BACI|nr:DUF2953 domain-containing protein [Virgibacillus profundi]PAV30146.1 hypothetical protein CIL05_06680 [Virgibacillus profundi]PXY54318.1 DUF2953 domain-containing protein [Virgibacillus profundi]
MPWIFLIIIFLFLVLLFSRINITFNYTYSQNENMLLISVSIFRLKVFRKNVNLKDKNKNGADIFDDLTFDSFPKEIKNMVQQIKALNNTATLLLKNIQIHKLKWITGGGTGNADTTGIVSGGVWTLKGALIGLLAGKVRLKCKPIINIIPHFQARYIQTNFDCIVSIRLGQAIYALLKVMRISKIKEKAFI